MDVGQFGGRTAPTGAVGASRHFFRVLLLFSLLFCPRRPAHADDTAPTRSAALFVPGRTTVPRGKPGSTFSSFVSPCLAEVGGAVVAFAEAHRTEGSGVKIDIVEGHIELKGSSVSDVFAGQDATTRLTTQIVDTEISKAGGRQQSGKPKAVLKDSKFFVYCKNPDAPKKAGNAGLVCLFALGEIEGNVKQIKWHVDKITPPKSKIAGPNADDKAMRLVGGGEFGIVVNDMLVIPVTYKDNNDLPVSTIVYSQNNHGNGVRTWDMSPAPIIEKSCVHPAVVEWGKGKLLMLTSCEEGYRKVHESTDMGKKWTEVVGTLSRVWGNSPTRTGFGTRGGLITATIDSKTVMLFVQPVTLWNNVLGQLRLWMTDSTHIYNVGLISHENENATTGSLLYKDSKLYCLYEVYENGAHKVVLAELTEELQRIRYALRIWTALEKNLSQRCGQENVGSGASSSNCAFPIPTTGLVGFLSNSSDTTSWKEEYLCVGATVTKGTWVPNGLRFQGVGAGAQWPVGKQGQDRRYNFANYAFTLAVTMAIHAVPSKDTPVLGASLGQGAGDLLGLSVTQDKKWKIVAKAASSSALSLSNRWEPHQTYHVVLIVQSGSGFLYIDGQSVWNGMVQASVGTVSHGISHFYLGGNGENMAGTNTYVSVTNAFLYNRVLNDSEIKALFKNKVTIPKPDEVQNPPAELTKLPEGTPKENAGKSFPNRRAPVTGAKPKAPERKMESPKKPSTEPTSLSATKPSAEAVTLGKNAGEEFVYYGVTSYINGLHVRREVQIPRGMVERMKLGYVTSKGNRKLRQHNEDTDVALRERVGGVLVLSLGLLVFLIVF